MVYAGKSERREYERVADHDDELGRSELNNVVSDSRVVPEGEVNDLEETLLKPGVWKTGDGLDDFNPKGSDQWGTFITMVKGFVGVGILFLPSAFKDGGMTYSIVVLGFVAFIAYYCMICLARCSDKTGGDNFGEIARAAIGKTGENVVNGFLILAHISFCASYYIFLAEHIQKVVIDIDLNILLALLIPISAPLVWVRRVSRLEPASKLGTLLIGLGIIYIFYKNTDEIVSEGKKDVKQFNSDGWALFLGTAAFAFEGIGLVLPIRNNMQQRRHFGKLMGIAVALVFCIYAMFGFVGYLAYGDDVEAPITLNLAPECEDDDEDCDDDIPTSEKTMVKIVQGMYTVAVLCTFPLMMYPVVITFEDIYVDYFPVYKGDGDIPMQHKMRKNLFRTFCCAVAGVVAIVGSDNFDNFVALIGGFCCVPLAFIFPALFHIRLVSPGTNMYWVDVFVLIFGIAVMILATIESLRQW